MTAAPTKLIKAHRKGQMITEEDNKPHRECLLEI